MAITETTDSILSIGIKVLNDKKAEHIKVFDISGISIISDVLVIASGNNVNQIHAISDEIQKKLNENKYSHLSIEGYDKANWVLMDYNDVIFHIFDKESRNFYDLERLYYDAKQIDIDKYL